ncbi:MAG: peptidoglycan glycosyltransferase [Lachnospiraceae bacterium]|nr:peptidoglycan glycosyltransferase [Lachnospiraceae bacterium]
MPATRGCIYDRNGKLLAYNELAYAVTIEDSGTYDTSDEKNKALNSEIAEIITHLEKNGDTIDNEFGITRTSNGTYEYVSTSDTAINRFRADVFGHASIVDLETKNKYDLNETNISAPDMMKFLFSENKYDISDKYDDDLRYKICIVRYNMSQNNFKKYIATVISSSVSDASVAYIKENSNTLTGVAVEEKSARKYVDSKYFSHIIGYTGTISTEEYDKLSEDDETIEMSDVVGKSGLEQYMDKYLSGTKGTQTIYVDNVGSIIDVSDKTEAIPGNDVYTSIDHDLQVAAYNILENELASILYSKIANVKTAAVTEDESDIIIPIYDVYYSFINNGLIDTDYFETSGATDTEKAVLQAYNTKEDSVIAGLNEQLRQSNPTVYNKLPEEYQKYSTYIVTMLKSNGIFDANNIDSSDEMQIQWTNENLSVNEYLKYAIEMNWIDITKFSQSSKYEDTDEIYNSLVDYVLEELKTDSKFEKLVYKYVILQDMVSGNQLCAILYDQGVLPEDEAKHQALISGGINSYGFVLEKIKNRELTPGQLALDPCSGSVVIIDPNTGELLACVSYPGYDNNRLANNVDSQYYKYLNSSLSNPLYNYATQQRTAPGSTYKIVSSFAGLKNGVITPSTTIVDQGVFEKVSNKPKCWAYPSNHGAINVASALRYSCNYFFYEVGYQLAGGDNNYDDEVGINKLSQYASLFGLDSKTGVEIQENQSELATQYPVMAAIGQSDNNITTIALARYIAAVANHGTVYDLTLLDHVQDSGSDKTIESYKPSVKNQINTISNEEWNVVNSGLRMVVEDLSAFDNVGYQAAGKTGTAQQVHNRPNHALFVGYAPYDKPEIAVATRIAYGYSSSNAALVSSQVMSYYFGETTLDNIVNGNVENVNTSNTVAD